MDDSNKPFTILENAFNLLLPSFKRCFKCFF